MTPGRVYRRPSLQQQDRLPVSSYEEAVRSLVCLRCDVTLSDESYDVAVRLIADIFWRNDLRVRRDARVASKDLGVDLWTR